MSASDLIFFAWWYGSGLVLAFGTWTAVRRGEQIDYEVVLRMVLVGIAVGLTLYLVPNGVASIDSPTDFKLRLLAALAIAWTAAALATRPASGIAGRPAVALAAFIGVNAPPLALVLSATMVCGGHPNCL